MGTTAVLLADVGAGARQVAVYVPGLGGVWGADRRQSYEGYYVGTQAGGPCEAALTAVDERTGHDWGHVRLVLTERGFPTTILMLMSPCGGTDEALVVGEPVVGQ